MGKKTYSHPREYTTDTFKNRLVELYGDRFKFDKVEYNGAYEKIILTCPIHGDFAIRACRAARGDASCKKCSAIEKSIKSRTSFKEIIERIKKLHPQYCIDEKQSYKNTHTKIKIKCPIHGEFEMTPNSIFNGQGCPKCGREKTKLKRCNGIEWLKSECKKVHGDEYDLSKFNYVNSKTKGIVICKKHGEFKITPEKLIHRKQGCPFCKRSHLENDISLMLKSNNMEFIPQYRVKWLGLQSLDFYIPSLNIAIECQGIQHFKPTRFGGILEDTAVNHLKYVKYLDEKKKKLCEKNGVKLLYFNYNDNIDEFYKRLMET